MAGDLMEGGKPPRGCKQSLRPYEKTPIYLVGDDLPGVPKNKRIPRNKQSACHPELVELLLSEERGRSARRSRSGIWLKISVAPRRKCYIRHGKSPKLVAISHRRCRSSVLLRYSLRKTSTAKTASRFSSLRMTC